MAKTTDELSGTQVQGRDRLLTVRDVADRLAVSTKTVYRLKSEGRLAYIKIGGSLRFREDDIDGLENRNRVTGNRYSRIEAEKPARLSFEFNVRKRGRGPRRR
jgi:excisionase family DNA binding protein